MVWDGQCVALAFGAASRGEEVKTCTDQGGVACWGVIANLALGLRGFKAGKDEKLFDINQMQFRKLWHQACRALGMP